MNFSPEWTLPHQWWAVGLLTSCLAMEPAMFEHKPIEVIDSQSVIGQQWIRAAMPEFLKKGLTPEGYRIIVMRIGGRPTVMFSDSNRQPGQRGSASGQKPGFEVELDSESLKPTRASYVR